MTARAWQPEWALELALGILEGADRDAALAALAMSTDARAEVAAARELLAELPSPADEPLPPGLRAQVLSATEPASRCLGGFARRVGELFDLDEEAARALLATIGDGMLFEPGLVPGAELAHVHSGPRMAKADSGFVRFPPGLHFPMHEHLGDEAQIILTGSLVDDAGREYLPGDVLRQARGSRHAFTVGASEPCLVAVVIFEGIHIVQDAG